ncbi:dihydrodipicolinate synthase family protein [Abyssibius alkaniclasticus]|uniref:dihydrodipicolinate synthase family protein n=1 Tax=Abyssibius alkaniclasticus TaxID=2881234 RepID=UPI0040587DCC
MTLPKGIVAPILTPFNDDLRIAHDLYLPHAKALLEGGCGGLSPFGTTGEALSVASAERVEAIKRLIAGGVPAHKLVPGTGLTNLPETADLSRKCLDMGCAAVMVLPPFYFKGVPEDGLYAYFSTLIAAIGDDARIVLYHIPQVAGVGIPASLAARLRADFPAQIVGIKDSSGDWDNTAALLEIPGLAVFPGSELPMIDALARGARGTISATANINPEGLAEAFALWIAGDGAGAQARHDVNRALRLLVQGGTQIADMKRLLALAKGDARWANTRPPLLPTAADAGAAQLAKLRSAFNLPLLRG